MWDRWTTWLVQVHHVSWYAVKHMEKKYHTVCENNEVFAWWDMIDGLNRCFCHHQINVGTYFVGLFDMP